MSSSPSVLYAVTAFLLLGIERFLYSFVFHFPQNFIERCKSGTFGTAVQKEDESWKGFMYIGMRIKIFQFSVIAYDVFVENKVHFQPTTGRFMFGAAILMLGQVLNAAAFKALGCIGVYYGHELGYKVPRVAAFPYNLGFSDPQYWGVVATIFGLYIMLDVQSFFIPFLELFWYGMSMAILEHSTNGRYFLKALLGKSKLK
jgi:hypothetical protein